MKMCTNCNKTKKLSDFRIKKSHIDGLTYECKECIRLYDLKARRTKQGVCRTIYYSQIQSSKRRGHSKPSYTKKWLKKWLIGNPEFHRLYDLWAINGYKKSDKPSVDRIDDNIGYTEYNIQLMIWDENRSKEAFDMRKGKLNTIVPHKAVIQLTKKNKYVASYISMKEAQRHTGVQNSHISACCNGKRKSAGGFIWRLADA